MTLTRPTTLATRAMVATPHHLATTAGVSILEAGGSAMDAAIAANAVLTVVYPDQTAIGGDCFFLAFDASTGEVTAYNGSGTAPAAADPAVLIDQGWSRMPVKGPYSITVPGTIDAWFAGHERFGRLTVTQIMNPAIALARDGFAVSPRLAGAMRALGDLVYDWPSLRSMMFPNGEPPREGTRLRFPLLASSLETIAAGGRDTFYTGEIGAKLARAVRDAGGWLTVDDLAAHRGSWVDPISATYRGTTVLTTPPNSQGLAGLIGLKLLERTGPGTGWGAAPHLHAMVEAAHRAHQVRNEEITDPRDMNVTVDELLDEAFLDDLWSDFDPDRISGSTAGTMADTVYLCVVDADGNAVS
ncbi:MAG TPA: gamma-glutamyltransferase, partial [Thermomicrobiales bacterium]|nr:gamma-glutamyltransferase [Thermomicrobiales bacterium]